MPTQPHDPIQSLVALVTGGTAAGRWVIDPDLSSVTFAVKHFWGLMTVRGHFTRFTGEADVTPDGVITAHLTIEADSVDTRQNKRDAHLRSSDFFDTARHPAIAFTTPRCPSTPCYTSPVSSVRPDTSSRSSSKPLSSTPPQITPRPAPGAPSVTPASA